MDCQVINLDLDLRLVYLHVKYFACPCILCKGRTTYHRWRGGGVLGRDFKLFSLFSLPTRHLFLFPGQLAFHFFFCLTLPILAFFLHNGALGFFSFGQLHFLFIVVHPHNDKWFIPNVYMYIQYLYRVLQL